MNKKLRAAAAFLAAMMALTALPGCNSQKQTGDKSPVATETASPQKEKAVTYPLKNPVTITCFFAKPSNLQVDDYAKTEYSKELEKRTNVTVKYIHPPAGDNGSAFQLMIAARDLPDVVLGTFGSNGYPAGIAKAKDEGIVLSLNDYIKDYAPDYYKVLKENPMMDKLVKYGNDYLNFQFLQPTDGDAIQRGLTLRGDWLEELGLPVPETVEDWDKTLKAFKEKKGAKNPLGTGLANNTLGQALRAFSGCYNVGLSGFIADKGVVKFSPMESGYKEFLTLMNDWYKKGYISPEAVLMKVAQVEADVVNGKSGAFEISSGGISRLDVQGVKVDPKFKFVSAPYPVLKKGDTNRFRLGNQPASTLLSAAIMTTNKYPKETAMWLNYGYTKEGSLLNSFGIKGVTYEEKDGKLQFTDYVNNNPDKLPFVTALLNYARGGNGGPFIVHKDYYGAQDFRPAQQQALKAWNQDSKEYYNNPTTVYINAMTEAETAERSQILAPVDTYVAEMFLKFIIGEEPLSKYDAYVAQLKKMEIEKATKITQAAYDRFMKN